MENLYTEKILKKCRKERLLDIAAENEITVPDGATNPQIIQLILDKGCIMPEDDSEEYTPPESVGNSDADKYTKTELLKSSWYSHKRKILGRVLEDGKSYSLAVVEQLLRGAK